MYKTKHSNKSTICIALSIFAIVGAVQAHENHAHKEEPKKIAPTNDAIISKINNDYVRDVKPIFQKSCFDCHSSTTNYPWYAKIPGVKQLIESDISESKEHLDLSRDFPFGGHGTPLEDLRAIQKAISAGSMPPFRYRILHSESAISADDANKIENWIRSSIAELESK